MSLFANACTDVGLRRQRNEDSFHCDAENGIFIVCDGMGGHSAGDVASRAVVDTLVAGVHRQLKSFRELAQGGRDTRRLLLEQLRQLVLEANDVVYQQSQANEAYRGMGTTLCIMLVFQEKGFIAHVGDSRIYLVRNQQTHQITTDHTVFQELFRAGRVTLEERKKNPALGALTRAVGVYPTVQVDTLDVDLLPRDVFVLCSDGLHGYLEDFDLSRFLDHTEPAAVSSELVEFANRRGGLDNITAVTVRVAHDNETSVTLRLRLTLKTLRGLSLFQHLSYSDLLQVVPACEPIEVPSNTPLMQEGEQGDAMYVVISGEVRVHRGEAELARLGVGRHVGEMALVDHRPRSASVTTTMDSVVIRLERSAFFEVLRNDSVLAVKLLWNIIQTLSATLRTSNDEQFASANIMLTTLDPFSENVTGGSSDRSRK
jgi:serine/threonine protein phosphatase PrpC